MGSGLARIGAAAAAPAIAAALLASAPALAAANRPSVASKPGLSPAFDPNVTDYVSGCRQDEPLRLSIDAPSGVAVGVDGARPKSGSFKARVSLRTGQATDLVVRSQGRGRRYHVRCLPRDFPKWSFKRFGRPQAQWFLFAPVRRPDKDAPGSNYLTFIDGHGVPVWWRRQSVVPFNSLLMPSGLLAWARWYAEPFGMAAGTGWEVHRLDGGLVRTLRTRGSPTDLHDMRPLANGDYLLISYRLRRGVDLTAFGGSANGAVVDGVIQELSPSGRVVWSWSSKDRIDLSENELWRFAYNPLPDGTQAYDYFHLNSVEPDGDGLVISARHVDAVYRIDRASGDVTWKLGGTKRPESLRVVGNKPTRTFVGQHDARPLPDGTLTVFDNHTFMGTPRGVRFRIDAGAGTATLLEQVTEPSVRDSAAEGSATRLAGGDWVVSWGATNFISEASATNHAVWRLKLVEAQNYRVQPIPFGRLAASTLRGAMDRMHPR